MTSMPRETANRVTSRDPEISRDVRLHRAGGELFGQQQIPPHVAEAHRVVRVERDAQLALCHEPGPVEGRDCLRASQGKGPAYAPEATRDASTRLQQRTYTAEAAGNRRPVRAMGRYSLVTF